MMIGKADFERLLPEIFRVRDNESLTGQPSAECVARWEDDGGRTAPAKTPPPAVRGGFV
ncbi:hypothetical protein GI582_05320 [Sulfitobacter sp. BDSS02]|uniref:hypothetical protein n=1 Tax=Heliomarina sp. TaxID=2917556 RepID=UPI004057D880|nr:hypothetical protein [Sulfitobacter sp. BDSS02]MBR9848466.1 hypothetical protein [Paracoccaceae bacterium]